jgi:hypothetical protein
MRWSDYVTGEYWITPSGRSEFADIDVGEAGHEIIATQEMIDPAVLIEHGIVSADDADEWMFHFVTAMEHGIPDEVGLAAIGGDPELWKLFKKDPRMAYARTGAILAINQDFAVWEVNDHTIKLIQDFLYDQAFENGDIEAEDVADLTGDILIEEYGTGNRFELPVNDFLTAKHKRDLMLMLS